MIPYWSIYLFVLAGVLFPGRLNERSRRLVWFVTFVLLTAFIGLRHDVGGDWGNYLRQFYLVADMTFVDAVRLTKDIGYYPLGWIIAHFGGSVYLLNLFCAVLLVVGTMSFAQRQPLPWLALLAAVPYLLIVVGMGYTRQAAAIGCAMLGLVALGDGRLRTFVLWVMVGAAFHKSAALLIPIAALAATRHRAWTAFWVAAMALLGYWLFIAESQDVLWQNYVASDYADAAQGAQIRVAMNALPAVILLLFRRRLCPEPGERLLWTWLAVLALVTVPLLALSATAVDRMALYFIPLQLFVFGRITRVVSSTHGRTFLVLAVAGYYAAVQFVWLNFANHAHAWVPYQFVLW